MHKRFVYLSYVDDALIYKQIKINPVRLKFYNALVSYVQ